MSVHEDPPEHARTERGNAGLATFEAQMRARRLTICIKRATLAMDEGNLDEARAAVGEAKSLAPDAPEIAQLESLLEFHSSPTAIPHVLDEPIIRSDSGWPEAEWLESDPKLSRSGSGWPTVLAGACALIVMLSALGFGLIRLNYRSAEQLIVAARASGTSGTSGTGDVGVTRDKGTGGKPPEVGSPAGDASPGNPAPTVPGTPAPRPTVRAKVEIDRLPSPDRPPRPAFSNSAAMPTPPEATEPLRIPPVEPVRALAEPATMTASALASGVAPAAVIEESTIVSIPITDTERIGESRRVESDRIRSVLVRYENAYNRLDAKAASTVWPRVDQAALGRAFSGLITQRVSLGLCEITVIGNIGGASCAGKAKWEPKIGGGLQTADRYWSFNLRKTDDGWKIEELKVR